MTLSAAWPRRLTYLPLGWLGLFVLFVAVKRLQYPSYAAMLTEDPKDLGMGIPHDFLFLAAIYIFLFHPLVWLLCTGLLRLRSGYWPRLRAAMLSVLCYAAFWLCWHYLPQPLINWFCD